MIFSIVGDVDWGEHRRGLAVVAAVLLAVVVVGTTTPYLGIVGAIFTIAYLDSAIFLAVPIALVGIGGLYSEKSGLINIGIEGLLIISAFLSVYVVDLLGGGPLSVWIALVAAVGASTLLALVFGVICIEYNADQIIAGLAVWFVALGFAPFMSRVIWGKVNSPTVATFDVWTIPVLSEIPILGRLIFTAYPTTYMAFVIVPVAWYVLNYTTFGMWVEASGEHPEALDTAGVDVNRVRYASVLVSGVLSGIGGTAITLSNVGQFIGQGATMVNGRGFIGIVTYLMGNYNPLTTALSALLFAGLEALQIRLQQVGLDIPPDIVGTIPFIAVIIVLVLFGYTRPPARVGENYQSGEE